MEHIFKAVVIDDEADGRDIIILLLGRLFPGIVLAGEADSVAAGIDLVQHTLPDIVFLDVQMPDGNAFDLLEACGDRTGSVILVTAYDHYAIQGIKASVADYLLKPVNKEEFREAVDKVLKKERHTDMRELLDEVRRISGIRKVRIPTLQGFILADVDDILRCEASRNYTIIHFKDRQELVSRNLGEYEEELAPFGFVRIHHKHLVNVNQIKEYNKGKNGGGYVTVAGRPEQLEVSSRKKGLLLRALGK